MKAVIVDTMTAITDINNLIDKMTPDNIELTKTKIIASIDTLKCGLKLLYSLMGVEVKTFSISSNIEFKQLNLNVDRSTQDLEKYLHSLK